MAISHSIDDLRQVGQALVPKECPVTILIDGSVGHDIGAMLLAFIAANYSPKNAEQQPQGTEPACKDQQSAINTQQSSVCLPLILTPYPRGRMRNGFSVPRESVLSIYNLEDIPDRCRQLVIIYQAEASPDVAAENPEATGQPPAPVVELPIALIRSMCVGAFRKYLYLDDENHGQGEMDFAELASLTASKITGWTNRDGVFWPCVVLKRLRAMKSDSSEQAGVFKALFPKEIPEIEAAMERLTKQAGVKCGESQCELLVRPAGDPLGEESES